MSQLYVIKRGKRGTEEMRFDKITNRLRPLCADLSPALDPTLITMETIQSIYPGIKTSELDIIAAKKAEQHKLVHPDYGTLAARICISNLHKSTPDRFSEAMEIIFKELTILSPAYMSFIRKNAAELDNMIIHTNDYQYDYFGYQTLENGYLVRVGDKIVERPQYVYMRVAIALYVPPKYLVEVDGNYGVGFTEEENQETLERIKVCYKALSQMYFTNATPTLFNACMKSGSLASCFLLGTEDSIEGIMKTVTDASLISKRGGGVGIHMSNIRAEGSHIKGTNGKSAGLVRQIKIYNEAARCWNQGGKRLGAFKITLAIWHGDIMSFLEMKLQNGAETARARDLFYGLWVPDLFFQRVHKNEMWSLFSEDTAPGLSDVYDGMERCTRCSKYRHQAGEECTHEWVRVNAFTELYERYEKEGRAIRKINARQLMEHILPAQREAGVPYVAACDSVNRKSNQANIGTTKSGNLCQEIYQVSTHDSYATCTLSGMNLKRFIVNKPEGNMIKVGPTGKGFDLEKLHEMTELVVRNLDNVIDINRYPVPECVRNSVDYRPLGIGIQGLADVFSELRLPFLSQEAEKLDLLIAETMYHAALTSSIKLARERGPYAAWKNSPAYDGKLQFDLWEENNKYLSNSLVGVNVLSGRYDWDKLKAEMKKHGLRNSLLIAHMPTVSTSQIMGNNESFEPYNANIYAKTALGGTFTVTNNAMIRHLIQLGLWTEEIRNAIITNEGSIQNIEEIPADVKEIYKTVWELSQQELMTRTAKRTAFVDQGASLNIHLTDNSDTKLRSVMWWGWQMGLKTISYYIRTPPAAVALKNNISESSMLRKRKELSELRKRKNNLDDERSAKSGKVGDDESDGGACEIGCTSCKL